MLVPAGSLSSLPEGNPTMSGGLDVLQMKEEDVLKFLAAGTHLGGTNLDFQMEQYIYKRKSDGRAQGWEAGFRHSQSGRLQRFGGQSWGKMASANA